ncbi:uncharacterized protein LOC108158654 [Drosophila miranda]|uniref:uncharacterized protein LOC108158654 n=1 Tax=Drosophila miranda TaxID=7229 RepID=UPI0007E665B7|nr:uncharacterized protein LOC108158654 [Drosophila miranda]XP_033250480.1 uncharacterized protein LOC108158654 [Drosophila miranda]
MNSSVTGCKRIHSIEVEQLQDSEEVQHSFLLIKGRLEPKCSAAKQLKATLELRDESLEQLTQLSSAGEFKLLFDLHKEERERQEEPEVTSRTCLLQLRSCSGSRLIRFTYKPRSSPYRVQPLYIVCQDEKEEEQEQEQEQETNARSEHSARCSLIDLNLRLVQCIYAHKLHAAGFANRTFTLNGPCRLFRSQLTTEETLAKTEDELWQHFAGEILSCAQWGQQLHLKFVAFVACTRYDGAAVAASGDLSYANIRRHLRGHAALGGGGLALFGSAHFYSWPRAFAEIGDCVRSAERVDVARLPDESNYRRTYGGVYASTLGAVCHELGHCFDLGHTLNGVMGQGFDYLNRVLTVDQVTEHLPQRIVDQSYSSATLPAAGSAGAPAGTNTRSRLTQLKLKQPSSQLLDNYHGQRRNDSFYFARNCAVILAHHRWLSPDPPPATKTAAAIHLSKASREIVSSTPLRLVELRCNLNSLVAHYEELCAGDKQQQEHRFQLPASLWHLLAEQRTHYVFVLTASGDTKRLACDDAEAEADSH